MSINCGLGYRDEIADSMSGDALAVVEVMAEHYRTPLQLEELRRIRGRFGTVVPHGVNLSIGSTGRVSRRVLEEMRRVCEASQAPYYSDHLAVTSVGGLDLGHLTPMWYTDATLRSTIARVDEVQQFLGLRLVLENITYSFEIPHNEMSEAEFFHRLTDATGCGMHLDATNLFTNSVNHRFDARSRLLEMPLHAVVHVHVAGGKWVDGELVDGHCSPVHEESWQLLGDLVRQGAPLQNVVLEHDEDFPDFQQLLDQVARARRITVEAVGGGTSRENERSVAA